MKKILPPMKNPFSQKLHKLVNSNLHTSLSPANLKHPTRLGQNWEYSRLFSITLLKRQYWLRKTRHTIETKAHRFLCYCLPKSYFKKKNGLNANFYISNTFYIFQTTEEYTYIVCDNFSKLAITVSQIKKKVCLNISFLQSEFTFLSTKCKYYSCFYCLLVRKSPTCQRSALDR